MNTKQEIKKEAETLSLTRYAVKAVQFFETCAVKFKLLNTIYEKLFYTNMVNREFKFSGIKPGMRVLHVGCGPMPYTSIALAKMGVQVTAVDCEAQAVEDAAGVVIAKGLEHSITVKHKDGLECAGSDYDGIWLSLHAEPKKELIGHLISTMNEGAVIIYRNPRTWLKMFYKKYYPVKIEAKTKNILGKESVKLEKKDIHSSITLELMGPNELGTIIDVPAIPLLNALGYRPGKQIKVKVQGMLNGPVIVEIEGRNSAITRSLARSVKVRPNYVGRTA